ncbi:MAG: DsbA family protein [Gammaproteobacteria bacterium]|nr:DsbA family protein [Gammaproteobacteria bacterium]
MEKPQILFVTDPLCSWCWGTLPEVEKLRHKYEPDIEFNLLMAGLQIGSKAMTQTNRQRLLSIWEDVTQTTGQRISGRLPDDPDFVYHSEIPCRVVKIFQLRKPQALWPFFNRLQQAFYLDAINITRIEELTRLAFEFEFPTGELTDQIHHPHIIEATREDFMTAKQMGALALPTLYMDSGKGMKLLAGGYTTASMLEEIIEARKTVWL